MAKPPPPRKRAWLSFTRRAAPKRASRLQSPRWQKRHPPLGSVPGSRLHAAMPQSVRPVCLHATET
eukprot:4813378-Lingulodinium_polyedra.AAC.1